MEQLISNQPTETVNSGTTFIDSNTERISLDHIRDHHIIPVFAKDNEPLISQTQFIDAMLDVVQSKYEGEVISEPSIRLSHPIKGRIPDARYKASKDLLDHEKTVYYERMIFKIDIESITTKVEGQELCLSVGGVKTFNKDSVGKDSRSLQHFSFFSGFKNTVCSNLCIWSDGLVSDSRLNTMSGLYSVIGNHFDSFEYQGQVQTMNHWTQVFITESQFAHFLGRCRLYSVLAKELRAGILPLELTDSQITSVARGYEELNTGRRERRISMWQFYNLLTESIKSSYIDGYMGRCVNSYDITNHLSEAISQECDTWYLN
jgi:hypothetical protein